MATEPLRPSLVVTLCYQAASSTSMAPSEEQVRVVNCVPSGRAADVALGVRNRWVRALAVLFTHVVER